MEYVNIKDNPNGTVCVTIMDDEESVAEYNKPFNPSYRYNCDLREFGKVEEIKKAYKKSEVVLRHWKN